MTIPTQKEWVEGCLAYYKENDYQPGNPEDGVWQECHYPVPKCLGGTETLLLLREHHAVQGVLQSEEFQHPCFWGWEKKFLGEEFLKLYKKWEAEKSRVANALMTSEKRSQASIKGHAKRTTEERSEIARKREAKKSPQLRKEIARNAALAGYASLSHQQQKEKMKRMREARQETPEQAKKRARETNGKATEVLTPWGVLLSFGSLSEAAETFQLRSDSLCNVALGKRRHTKGFIARYA